MIANPLRKNYFEESWGYIYIFHHFLIAERRELLKSSSVDDNILLIISCDTTMKFAEFVLNIPATISESFKVIVTLLPQGLTSTEPFDQLIITHSAELHMYNWNGH